MSAPADVWAVERADGSFVHIGNNMHLMVWSSRKAAEKYCLKDSKPVRFRLVRADEPEQPERESMRHSIDMLLRMIAMVPERDLDGMICDPYGVIGDALECIGVPRTEGLDSWRALSIYAHGFDCGEQKPGDIAMPEQPAEPPRDDVGEMRECVHELASLVRDHSINLVGSIEFAELVDGVIDRLAALDRLTPENPDA